ncbi:ribonuclease III domain-containing protein [Biscogniauxia sp. FL1348]|nr:ribonuclease III domain-containing protein [Biscogniauxia sp. FL1348]
MVAKAQKVLDYEFKTPELLWEGLQAPGSNVTSLNGRDIPGGNKPLAGVGDKVFALVTVLDSYERGTTANLLRAMVSNYQLATVCDNSGLTECINQNPCQVGLISPRTKADTVEAVIGAAYRDGGLDAARQVMKKLKLLKES